MRPLSDRLLAEAAASSLAEIGYEHRISLLREAAALAKRYEDAPVATPAMLGGVLMLSDIDAECLRLTGQRVRIVLDKEG